MADIQLQIQNIIKLAKVANTQLAEIKTTILQASNNYRTQMAGDISSISQDLQNIIQGDMENQAYHIQMLLADKLDSCKGKGNIYADEHIKKIQNVYKQEGQEIEQPIIVDKGKQWDNQVQDEEVLLYKLYNISSYKSKIFKLTFIQYMKYVQSPVKKVLFYPPPYYKSIQP